MICSRGTGRRARWAGALVAGLFASTLLAAGQAQRDDGFRFRSSVDLVNVTATVTDSSGRFVPGLTLEDFEVYENGVLQHVSHFSGERVPVSLGIAVDTSGSMQGERIQAARAALARFLHDLLDPEDEIFLMRFSEYPDLMQSWTTDRDRLGRAVQRLQARGGTALYDAVAESLPLTQSGQNRKKALLVLSDGNDTSSRTRSHELRAVVRETEVLVYAIALDAPADERMTTRRAPMPPPRRPLPIPFPIPGRRPGFPGYPPPGGGGGGGGGGQPGVWTRGDGGANVVALRQITDESGGRTEVIRYARDLDPVTESIAYELSQQYYLGYSSNQERTGQWHSIEVRVKGQKGANVRARRGYIATP
jgi:Ca-activated chloride channel homolog